MSTSEGKAAYIAGNFFAEPRAGSPAAWAEPALALGEAGVRAALVVAMVLGKSTSHCRHGSESATISATQTGLAEIREGGDVYNVAVVGATGLVGQEFLKIALQRRFPIKGLRLLASHRSAGKKLTVGEWAVEVEETTSKSFQGMDLAFFSATTEVSRELIPAAVKAGAICIDDSSAWRMEPDVPLVVPEVNAEDLKGTPWHHLDPELPNDASVPGALAGT